VLAEARHYLGGAVDHHRSFNSSKYVVGKKRQSGIVIEMRMRDDDVPHPKLFFKGQGMGQGACVQSD
jgi:hypothetical protein